jgi:hypothetical protein
LLESNANSSRLADVGVNGGVSGITGDAGGVARLAESSERTSRNPPIWNVGRVVCVLEWFRRTKPLAPPTPMVIGLVDRSIGVGDSDRVVMVAERLCTGRGVVGRG